jgi:hypothetical protein|nr:MAG TPA: hypothetical protein [Caudoviricetes sp.]
MAETGLRVYTDDGEIVISESYVNFWYDKEKSKDENFAYGVNCLTAYGCSPSNEGRRYVFSADSQQPSEHGTGLQVINEVGRVVYDSNWLPLKVLHYSDKPGYTIPTDKECAIVQCNDEFVYYYAVYEDAAWDAWGVLSGVRLRVKDGVVVFESYKNNIGDIGRAMVYDEVPCGQTVYMVVDVSHIK